MIDSGFRYWLSDDYSNAVALLFHEDKAHMFAIDVQLAVLAFPDNSLDEAIYTMATNLFNAQTDS